MSESFIKDEIIRIDVEIDFHIVWGGWLYLSLKYWCDGLMCCVGSGSHGHGGWDRPAWTGVEILGSD